MLKRNTEATQSGREESLPIVLHIILHWQEWAVAVTLVFIFLFRYGWYSVILWAVILLGVGFALILRLTRPHGSL